jgi:hypothetical protein
LKLSRPGLLAAEWVPLGDEYYSDKVNQHPKRPHFLYVTASDPNESLLGNVLHEAMLRGLEKLQQDKEVSASWYSWCARIRGEFFQAWARRSACAAYAQVCVICFM